MKNCCHIFVKYQLSGIMDNAVASCVHGYELTAPNVCMCLRHIPTMPSVLKVNLIYGGVIDTLLWPMGRRLVVRMDLMFHTFS